MSDDLTLAACLVLAPTVRELIAEAVADERERIANAIDAAADARVGHPSPTYLDGLRFAAQIARQEPTA